jgi:hypothetical protein
MDGVFCFMRYLSYMKKVVRLTESDLTRIVKRVIKEQEDDNYEIPSRLRRRILNMEEKLEEVMDDPDNDPSDFSDEFEYTDNIIEYMIQELLGETEDSYIEDNENEISDFIKETYGEYIMDRYRSEVGFDDW